MNAKAGRQIGGRRHWARRDVLGILGAAGAATLAGHAMPKAAGLLEDTAHPETLDCIVTPSQTEGPYFVDERLNRADLLLDPSTNAVKPGVPLRLAITVARVDGGACGPVEGALVDVWQCDALGVYSDVRDRNGLFDTRGQKFLRGYQVTGRNGAAEFDSIYPGWYEGRAVHIHFKVRLIDAGRQTHEFTSQLYFDDAITDEVHAQAPYSAKGSRDTRNDRDRIYLGRDSGSKLMLRLSRERDRHVGTITVGLRTS